MKKKLTIALSSVIGTIALATAIAVPVTLHQKNKNKPLIINNDSSAITKPINIDKLELNDGNMMMDDNSSSMKSEPVDLSSLINKASFGLIITSDSLPTEKEIIDLVKKENPGLNEKALQSLSVENISKQGSTITSKNKDDFSGEIKLEYRARTNSEQEKYNNETAELVKTTWNKSFKNRLHSLMTFGEIFEQLVKKVNREDSKIFIEEKDKGNLPDSPFKNNSRTLGNSGTTMNGGQPSDSSSTTSSTSQQKEFKIKIADKTEIKLELGKISSGTVPTKYIDKNGKEVSSTSWDLRNIEASEITQIGYHDHKGTIKVNKFPKNVKKVPSKLPSVITSLEYAFEDSESNKIEGIEGWDTSNITDLSGVFYNAKNFNQDISKWKTSNVTDMSVAFYGAKKFNSPLNSWDTSKVTTMRSMFYGAEEFNQDLSSWKTENVTDMAFMFYNAKKFNKSIKNWNVSKVTDHNNFCMNSGLNCKKEKDECKFENCPNFCCDKDKKCEACTTTNMS
ncbi:hypothetical protein MBOVa_3970 [Mycoplasmopsis bovis 8790]|nr:hypothetical protein MBOVa_3970 [Mycoplasmopsis bovis 8790]